MTSTLEASTPRKTDGHSKAPKTQQQIADSVQRITFRLADKFDDLNPRKMGVWDTEHKVVTLQDGSTIKKYEIPFKKIIVYTDAEGNEHKAAADYPGWDNDMVQDRVRDASTRSPGSSMSVIDGDPWRGINKRLDISNDPREWNDRFEPPTEDIRRQAVTNAASTLSTIRTAIATAQDEAIEDNK